MIDMSNNSLQKSEKEIDFKSNVKNFLKEIYEILDIQPKSLANDAEMEEVDVIRNIQLDLDRFLQDNLNKYIVEWKDPRQLIQNLFDQFITSLIEEKPKHRKNPIFTLKEINIAFNSELSRLRGISPIDYAKLDIPFIISPNTIESIIKFIITEKITPQWIDLRYWKDYYKNMRIIDESIKLLHALRTMILLVQSIIYKKKKLKKMVGT